MSNGWIPIREDRVWQASEDTGDEVKNLINKCFNEMFHRDPRKLRMGWKIYEQIGTVVINDAAIENWILDKDPIEREYVREY